MPYEAPQPQTMMEALDATVRAHGHETALAFKSEGAWVRLTWSQYQQAIESLAAGLIKLGLAPGDAVVLMGHNRPEWFIGALAVMAAAAIPAGVYPTSSAEQCIHIANHCQASCLIVEKAEFMRSWGDWQKKLPAVKAVILMEGSSSTAKVYSWDQAMELGYGENESVHQRIKMLKAGDTATLVYTSGTTSTPKGVQLSHSNLLWAAETVARKHFQLGPHDRFLSYLPLSHIAEQLCSLLGSVACGYSVYIAESLERLGENLKEVRPTLFFGVPRVWEKMEATIRAQVAKASRGKRSLFHWALAVGRKMAMASPAEQKASWQFRLAQRLVFRKVRAALGLDCCRFIATGAAPISSETLLFFFGMGLPLFEVYGMSECAGPTTLSEAGAFRVGSVGRPISGSDVRIAADGEILLKGPHVFQGYLGDPAATEAAFDSDGWLLTGDLGRRDAEGFLYVTGRKKNLIITAGGENIATELIESKLSSIPEVEHAVVSGDRRKYLTALLTLSPEAEAAARALGSLAQGKALASCPLLRAYLQSKVDHINASLAHVQTVKKFAILPAALTEAAGELTPTLKVKRHLVLEKFAPLVEAMYKGEESVYHRGEHV